MTTKRLSDTVGASTTKLVDAETLAYRYGVATKTIRKWGHEGRIPYVRISGKCTRYPVDECDDVMDALTVKEVAP